MGSNTQKMEIRLQHFLKPGALVAIAWSLYQLYLAVFGFQIDNLQRPLHLMFALMLSFISFPLSKAINRLAQGIDIVLIILSFSQP